MPFHADTPVDRRRQLVLNLGTRVLFAASLVYLLTLLVRLPIEDAFDAVQRYLARAAEVRQMEAVSLAQAWRTPGALQAERDRLQALDETAIRALERELHGFVVVAKQRRDEALLVIAVLLLTALGVAVLRRADGNRLRDQLHFSEQLIDAIPLPLSLRSPQGEFLLVNREFEKRMGVARAQTVGRPVLETISPTKSALELLSMDARAAAAEGPVGDNFQVPGEGGIRHIQVRVQAVRGLDGTLMGTVGVQTDMTAMVHNEAQLIETNAKLSQLSLKMIGAQEEERRRIARDLHDQVGQILTALKMQLASVARKQGDAQGAGSLAGPIDLVEEALQHTRDLSASLHPHLLEDLGLEAALHWLIDRFIRPSLPQIALRCQLQPARGPAASEMVAFRLVQESLTNVVRHAAATRVGVMLEAAEGWLAIEVIDDGAGFDAGQSWLDLQRTASVGVTSMHNRAAEAGGELHIESALGSGTSVRARLPW